MKKSPLILVDGSSYLFRAYHALPPLMNSQGRPTGAVYGVLNMLRKLLKDYNPEHIAVVFDPKGTTFRHDLFSDYKANRKAMPEELGEQIQPLFSAIKALGFPLIVEQGVEADDVIGTLTKRMVEQGVDVLISTSDKDMAQLVNDRVTLINTMTDQSLDPKGVLAKFGVLPEQIVDYLTLVGDVSDNIPGVPKVGPKTAAKWLNEYGSLEAIIENAKTIKGKVGENLRDHIKNLDLSRTLVTIRCDVTVAVSLKELVLHKQDTATLRALFTELEFNRWLADIDAPKKSTKQCPSTSYSLILSQADFEQWLARLKKVKYFSLDTETTSLDPMEAKLVGISFAIKAGEAAYVPIAHHYPGVPKQLKQSWVFNQLKPLLGNTQQIIIGQNLKYDYKILSNAGLQVKAILWDTLLESYVMRSTGSRHDLDTLALTHLNHTTIKYTEVVGRGAQQKNFSDVMLEEAGPYAAEDADIALQLHHHFEPLYKKERCFEKILKEIEWPLIPILAKMECHGVLINVELLKKQTSSLQRRITHLKNKIYAITGETFNIDSPKQLREILFDRLKIPVLKKTPSGQASTAEEVMQTLSADYPVPKLILEYRSYSKLKSTYTDKLPKQINAKTGRIHTNYIQTGTSTGRLASKDPNLQNIPIRTEEGRKIRQAFIAPRGYRIIAADYSQIELRIIAHYSQDPGLLHAFEHDLDVHASTASEVFGVDVAKVSSLQRRRAKAINFGLMYGMSAFGLSKQLGISRQQAQQYIDTYFSSYPKIHDYMEATREQAAKKGYVETLFGRRLFIPDIQSKNITRRKAAERAAINAPLQGTAADIIKLAMIRVDQWLERARADVTMIMQVHDELVFEVAHKVVDQAIVKIKQAMEGAAQLTTPLIVDIGVGKNWDEAH